MCVISVTLPCLTCAAYAVTRALEMARADGVAWLLHLDPDELLHPGAGPAAGNGGAGFSMLPELCGAPKHVPSIRCGTHHRSSSSSCGVGHVAA